MCRSVFACFRNLRRKNTMNTNNKRMAAHTQEAYANSRYKRAIHGGLSYLVE